LNKNPIGGSSGATFYGKSIGKRILQEKDILLLGLCPLEKVPWGAGYPKAIGKFIDQYDPSRRNTGFHRATFHQTRFKDKKA